MARISGLAMVMLLLAVALMPLSATRVYANDATGNDKESATQIVTSAIDPAVVGVDTGVGLLPVDVTPEPVLDDPVAYATVQINKQGCPQRYDGDYNQLAANCSPMAADFKVVDSSTAAVFTGSFTDDQVTPGDVSIAESIPAGYGLPVVFCDVYDAQGGESGFSSYSVSPDGILGVAMVSGSTLYCDWFNVPSDSGGGVIHIDKHACPARFDAYNASSIDLAATCTDSMDGVVFDLSGSGGAAVAELTTGGATPGAVEFGSLIAGTYDVSEQIPAGYGKPVVFCRIEALTHAPVPFQLDILNGNNVQTDLAEGQHLICDWYNVLDGGGTITVHKWSCPVDAALGATGWTDYQAACTDSMNGIDFTLEQSGSLVSVKNTGDDGDGLVTWTGLPAGAVTLTEAIPTGYGDPVVFCGFGAIIERNGQGIAVDGQIPPSATVGGVLTHDFLQNEQLYCDWFNIPSQETSITIYKYTCPAGYDLTAPGADAQADCLTLTDGVTFTLRHGADLPLATTTGDVEPGAVHWGGLSGGSHSVQEDVPATTAQTYVTCQWLEVTGAYKYESMTPYSLDPAMVGDTIDLSLISGERIVCQWYNSPRKSHDGGTLTVIKYWCDGAVYSVATCSLYGGGADFSLSPTIGGGAPTLFTTGADGTYGLSLPAGTWTLQEIGREWCRAQSSDVDGAGNLVTSDGHDSVVTIYNCGPGKKKEPPVRRFPNTGSGPAASIMATGGGGHHHLNELFGAVIALLQAAAWWVARVVNGNTLLTASHSGFEA